MEGHVATAHSVATSHMTGTHSQTQGIMGPWVDSQGQWHSSTGCIVKHDHPKFPFPSPSGSGHQHGGSHSTSPLNPNPTIGSVTDVVHHGGLVNNEGSLVHGGPCGGNGCVIT